MADLNAIKELVIKGKAADVKVAVQKAIDEKVGVKDILEKGLIAGMGYAGERF